MSEAPRLFQLQVIDLDLDEKRHLMQELEGRLGGTPAGVLAARKHLNDLEDESKSLALRMRQLEGEIEQRSAKIAALQKQLFGGGVGKQKEASALEKELQTLTEARGRLEDTLLDAMSEIEEMPSQIANARAEADRISAQWDTEAIALRAELERLRGEVASAEITRARMIADLSPEAIHIYDDLRRTSRGRAVARVERNTCMGCRVALPMGEVQQARKRPGLSYCSFCGRILFIER